MTRLPVTAPVTSAVPLPETPLNRAQGDARLSVQRIDGHTRLKDLYQAGSLKLVFPRSADFTGVLVNTAGGITGGDRFRTQAEVLAQGQLSLTTQAAERAYKARPGETGTVRTDLTARAGARLRWLPQETILFDGCALDRRMRVALDGDARALLVEPLVLGRAAMGEGQVRGSMRERIEIFRDGRCFFRDSWWLSGDLTDLMTRPGLGGGATAMASLVLVHPHAEALLEPVRALLPETGGASLRGRDLLVARCLAADGYTLRKALLPILDLLTHNTLPTCWRL